MHDENLTNTFDALSKMEGWDAFKQSPEEVSKEDLEKIAKTQLEFNIHFAKTFETFSGQKVLEYLEEKLEGMTFDPRVYPNPIYMAFFREGENALVRDIKDRIAKAKENK